jgi:hypothetical protein
MSNGQVNTFISVRLVIATSIPLASDKDDRAFT